METAGYPPNLTENTFGQHGHICGSSTASTSSTACSPFIKDGFEQGDKAYHYVDPELRDKHLRWLA